MSIEVLGFRVQGLGHEQGREERGNDKEPAAAAPQHPHPLPLPARPPSQVEYRDLDVTTEALVGSAAEPTVGQAFVRLIRSLIPGIKTYETRPLQVIEH